MKAITFYHDNINPELVKAQKSVFDHFGMELLQIKTGLTHGEAIDEWLRSNAWTEVAIFDIDCIPLNKIVLQLAHSLVTGQERVPGKSLILWGVAQKANHIPERAIYCSPAFCCFSRELWELAAEPTFKDIQWHDVGTLFSEECERVGAISLMYPTHVEVPLWDLRSGEKFGLGTTYGYQSVDLVYHAFQSRMNHGSTSRFIQKCKEVINHAK